MWQLACWHVAEIPLIPSDNLLLLLLYCELKVGAKMLPWVICNHTQIANKMVFHRLTHGVSFYMPTILQVGVYPTAYYIKFYQLASSTW